MKAKNLLSALLGLAIAAASVSPSSAQMPGSILPQPEDKVEVIEPLEVEKLPNSSITLISCVIKINGREEREYNILTDRPNLFLPDLTKICGKKD
jgi:hypothetical protein